METKRNSKRTILIVLAVICAVIILLLAGLALYVDHLIDELIKPSNNLEGSSTSFIPIESLPTESVESYPDAPTINISNSTMPTVPAELIEVEDVINVLLLGQDALNGAVRSRTDSIILCSIHTKNRTISLTSFHRDTWVTIPGYGHNKINAAYVFGGFALLKETMLYNFGLPVDFMMLVELEFFADVVDLLGGVDIDLEAREADHLNSVYPAYCWKLTEGVNHLTGLQALAYSRIRVIDSNFQRAERQKKLLSSIFDAYKQKPIWELLAVTSEILPMIYTYDLEKEEVYNYIYTLAPLLSGCTIESYSLPIAITNSGINEDGIWVLEADLEKNRDYLAQIIAP